MKQMMDAIKAKAKAKPVRGPPISSPDKVPHSVKKRDRSPVLTRPVPVPQPEPANMVSLVDDSDDSGDAAGRSPPTTATAFSSGVMELFADDDDESPPSPPSSTERPGKRARPASGASSSSPRSMALKVRARDGSCHNLPLLPDAATCSDLCAALRNSWPRRVGGGPDRDALPPTASVAVNPGETPSFVWDLFR